MATLEKAIALAAGAHAGQHDKEGLSYILHPLRVMMRVQGEEA
jgi:(p)ppGpp synthase/HD superfamily hydrolase